jgi:2-polyprenyl-6-methoxyphenol hydroxylase-like FAD-dependent oxidoreductase
VSPFAGEGANLAMYDGAELGKAIAANPDDVEAALMGYEKDLFPRSASAAAEADGNVKLFFDDNAPQGVVDLFTNYNQALSKVHPMPAYPRRACGESSLLDSRAWITMLLLASTLPARPLGEVSL